MTRRVRIHLAIVVAMVALSGGSSAAQTPGLLSLLGKLLTPILSPLLAPLSGDLLDVLDGPPGQSVQVLVRGARADVEAAASRVGLQILRRLDEYVVVHADGDAIDRLRREPGVLSLSGDLPVVSSMAVSDRAMAADQARAGSQGLLLRLLSSGGTTGRGVGVAIVDSGIAAHRALTNKVVASVSFVPGDSSGLDRFGHGTHIAGIIAGSIAASARPTPEYQGGIAPGAHLINVRVLGATGGGRTSDVIAGLDWVIANRTRYAIRVLNLSLGHPVTEPSLTDPLNASVARAVASGLVVVASAGNSGKAADGSTVLGSISSPGNSPHALTVGALNTWGTVSRSDDTVTTYSSRGPTKYEFAVKPDVVAPGNKIVSLEAAQSYLAQAYPTQHVAGSGTNAYSRMSGTSMAAGMVSGAAALLLEASPRLTPRHVKLAIQSGAQVMAREGLVASGAGSVNVWAARRVAVNGPSDVLPTNVIGGVPVRAGGLMFADAGSLIDRMYQGAGMKLLGAFEMMLVWSDPGRLPVDSLNMFGVGNPNSLTGPSQIIWGDMSQGTWGNQIIWGDHLTNPEGQQIIWGDTDSTGANQIIWGDQDSSGANQIIWGDTYNR